MRTISFILILLVISCSRREPNTVTNPTVGAPCNEPGRVYADIDGGLMVCDGDPIPPFVDIDGKGVSQHGEK